LSKEKMNGELKPIDSADQDILLVKAFLAGDRVSFDKLVLTHKDRLFNLVYWFLGDYEDSNDCAQEIFIKVFRSLTRFRFESTFSTWLYRITINTCKNRLKSSAYRKKRKTVPLNNPEGSEGEAGEIQDESPCPFSQLEKKERVMQIRRVVNSLPEEQKRALVLRDIQGLSYEEIRDLTGWNPGTVKSRIARARVELRNRLEGKI